MAKERIRKKRSRALWGTVRSRKNGTFTASYHVNGVEIRAPHTFITEVAARRWLDGERDLIDRGTWTPPAEREQALVPPPVGKPVLTVAEWAAAWFNSADIRATTRIAYERYLRIHILPELGGFPITQLTRQDVATWWTHKQGRPTDHLAYFVLHSMMEKAVEAELIEINPVNVKGAGQPSKERKIDPLTPRQVADVAAAMPPRWQIGVLLGTYCDLRSGELRELRRKDIDLVAAVLHVQRGVVRVGSELIVGPTKTDAGVRDMAIPQKLIRPLRQHMAEWVADDPEALIISTDDGKTVHDSQWWRAWKKALGVAGVDTSFHFHDLRHTGLTYAGEAGATLAELKEMGGHTTVGTAMRYQEVSKRHLDDVMGRLSEMVELPGERRRHRSVGSKPRVRPSVRVSRHV